MSDLSRISDEILKQDVETWEKAWVKASSQEEEEKARDKVNELWEELFRRLAEQRISGTGWPTAPSSNMRKFLFDNFTASGQYLNTKSVHADTAEEAQKIFSEWKGAKCTFNPVPEGEQYCDWCCAYKPVNHTHES